MSRKKKTFTEKIEDEIAKPRLSPKGIDQLVQQVKGNSELSYLFNELNDNPSSKKLLFLHRSDLFGFEKEIQIQMPYLHLCTMPKKFNIKNSDYQVSKTLRHIISSEFVNVEERGKNVAKDLLGLDEKIMEDLKDILAYFFIDFTRANPELKKLVNAKKFDYVTMKKKLGNFKNTVQVTNYFTQVWEGVDSKNKAIDPIIAKKGEKLLINIVSKAMKNLNTVVEDFSNLSPNIIFAFHKNSMLWIASILRKTRMSVNDYIDVLDDWYRYKMIVSKSTITWCESCSMESMAYSQHHMNISPSKLEKQNKCVSCGNHKNMSYGALFGIDKDLKEIIFSKDGVLPVYLAWCLDKHDIVYESQKLGADYETDVLVNGEVLVECKMFKSDKDDGAIQSELKNAAVQLTKQIELLAEDGVVIKQAVLLWNRSSVPDGIQAKCKRYFRELAGKYQFEILAPGQIEQFILDL